MRTAFSTLFRYELGKLFPKKRGAGRADVFGRVLSVLITLLVAAAFVFLLYTVAKSYVEIKVNKQSDPVARGRELLNVGYAAILAVTALLGVEKMRKRFVKADDRAVLLRLPVKPSTLYLSKMTVLLLESYVTSFLLILPVQLVVGLLVEGGAVFALLSLLAFLLLPPIALLLSALLLWPYMQAVERIGRHYLLTFLLFSGLLGGAFWLYSRLLSVLQALLETGSIRFLFNEEFLSFMQALRQYAYPANLLAEAVLGEDKLIPILILLGAVALSGTAVYFVTRGLFFAALYKNEARRPALGHRRCHRLSPDLSLIKKEFLTVFRTPSYTFSYFSIAAAMPVMIYCCYTLFEALVQNAIGLTPGFSLSLFIVLVFGVLTNTFCATNVSRDGLSALSSKTLPLSPTRILLSKVIFSSAVSTLSVIASGVLLLLTTPLSFTDALAVTLIGIAFTLSQILLATRMDLNGAVLTGGAAAMERSAEKTVAKVVCIGLILSALAGLLSFAAALLAEGGILPIGSLLSYLLPAFLALMYLLISFLYYKNKIELSFNALVS